MPRPAVPLLRLCAALLLVQAVLAPAGCLAAGVPAETLAVEICTLDGLRVLHAAAGDEAPDGRPDHGDACLACHALPQGAALPVPELPPPAWVLRLAPLTPVLPAAVPRSNRGPPGGARAPPAVS